MKVFRVINGTCVDLMPWVMAVVARALRSADSEITSPRDGSGGVLW